MAANPLSLTVDTASSRTSWRSYVLSLTSSVLIQTSALSALALVPLLSMGALPEPEGLSSLPPYVPVVPVARPAGAQKERKPSVSTSSARRAGFTLDRFVHVPLTEVVPTDDGFWEGLTSGVPEGVLEGPFDYAGDTGSATGQVDAPVVDGPAVAGVDVAPPRKRHDVSPVYPPIAASARIEGTVVLEAVIDREGNVSNLRVVKSIPLLDNAALEAVRQWKYEPTRLNGRPVPVVMTVTLSFVLKR